MAKRYSGNAVADIRLVEARSPAHPRGAAPDHYVVTVSVKGKSAGRVTIRPPASLRRSLDAPATYDEVAQTAFGDDEVTQKVYDRGGWIQYRNTGDGAVLVRRTEEI